METTRPTETWNNPPQENKKIVAGICAILIGGLGYTNLF